MNVDTRITLKVCLRYVHLRTGPSSETGAGPLNLSVNTRDDEQSLVQDCANIGYVSDGTSARVHRVFWARIQISCSAWPRHRDLTPLRQYVAGSIGAGDDSIAPCI